MEATSSWNEPMTRSIAHLHIPNFCAALEETRSPSLKGRPFVLAEADPRAVIRGVNRLAGSEGIREGMTFGIARRLCRRIAALPPDMRFYEARHREIIHDLGAFSPLIEGPLPGCYFADLTGARRLLGPCIDVSYQIKCLLNERGLPSRVGLASNRLVSQVAARSTPEADLACVFPGSEARFLSPLPVTHLPGVGEKTRARLADFNIETIGELASLSRQCLTSAFGRLGPTLLRFAGGMDSTPVLPSERTESIALVKTLDRAEIDRHRLHALLFEQAEEAGWFMRSHNRFPGRFTLEIRHGDGVTARGHGDLHPEEAKIDRRLFAVVSRVFDRIFLRRVAVRRIVIELSDFHMPLRQLLLFPWDEAEIEEGKKLQGALDRIRERFGRHVIRWGGTFPS